MAKTVLITGASRGIGRETARLFAQKGWNVAVNYHRAEDQAFALVQELTAQHLSAFAVRADVGCRAEVAHMVEETVRRYGAIHVLVNNSGIAQQKLFSDLTEEDWERMFRVNVTGMFHCCQCVLPEMLRRHSGSIVNLSSMWGVTGASCEVHYSASKAAVIGLTRALAKELGPSGITVNCVAPGVVETEMNAQLDAEALRALQEETPLGRLGSPQEVAAAVCFLASDDARFITGQVLGVNGGMVI
jgi:3-oxoacyl-[acyl-carrier protein] reductase